MWCGVFFISSVGRGCWPMAANVDRHGTGEADARICIRRDFRLGVVFGYLLILPSRSGAGLRGLSRAEAERRRDAGALHFCVA
jgi:hypothetical protein